MNKFIVTTTINHPTEATLKYCQKRDWSFIIIGDTKTPHEAYRDLEKEFNQVSYFNPEDQSKAYPELSESIGWKSIQRRNIGFVEAYRRGAEVVATVDDDNIPYDNWGELLLVGQEATIDLYEAEAQVFDPLSVTRDKHLWHRGFPIDLLKVRHRVDFKGKTRRRVLVQADLWDGDPDIDAMARLTFKSLVRYHDVPGPYCGNRIAPFNSQNTFLSREVLPFYACIPHIGRMDDIWGGYIMQYYFPQSVIYAPPTVYQERNVQDLITNLEKEVLGYRQTYQLICNLHDFEQILPQPALNFWQIYRRQYNRQR